MTTSIDNPAYISVDKRGFIYTTSEVSGWYEGLVSAFRFDASSGTLLYLNQQPTLGSIAVHNAVSSDGRFVLVANYSLGQGPPDRSVAVFPIQNDGSLGTVCHSIRLVGDLGPNPDRQERSHAHMISETPEGGTFIFPDLGLDKVFAYSIGAEGELSETASVNVHPGAGPRHVAQHINGRFIYVINEVDSTISVLKRDGETLVVIQTVAANQPNSRPDSADIHLSQDCRFLYCSNRGTHSISVFAVQPELGVLLPAGNMSSGGLLPRSFFLTPSGRHLLVGNQDSHSIAVFRRNPDSGELADTGSRLAIGSPVCVKAFYL